MIASQFPLLVGILFSVASSIISGVTAADSAISESNLQSIGVKRCTGKPIIRKEWYGEVLYRILHCTELHRRTLTKKEKKSYISAVQCILKKPAITPKDVAPGAVSRYDDLIVTHVLQFFDIHFTVSGHFPPCSSKNSLVN